VKEKSVYAVATMDTNGHELAFVAERLRAAGVAVVTVDVGTKEPPCVRADIDRSKVYGCYPAEGARTASLSQSDRGQAITAMSEALECYLRREFETELAAANPGPSPARAAQAHPEQSS
jgi:uncharacterized protein (UPF0261 family)